MHGLLVLLECHAAEPQKVHQSWQFYIHVQVCNALGLCLTCLAIPVVQCTTKARGMSTLNP